MTSRRWCGRDLAVIALLAAGCAVSVTGFAIRTFRPPDGSFSVTVPNGTMVEQTQPGSGPFTGSTVHFWTNGDEGPRLAVVYADATSTTLGTVDQRLATAAQGNVQTTGGTATDQHPVTVHGLVGLEQRLVAGDRSYVFRLFVVGVRLYSVSVTGTAAQVGAAHAVVFLDSFEAVR